MYEIIFYVSDRNNHWSQVAEDTDSDANIWV
jgi:hypothetical protein